MMSYASNDYDSEDFIELDKNSCFDESYFYNKKRNITVSNFEYNHILFFKYLKVKYVEGNVCDSEFILSETYIEHFLNDAKIQENLDNIDLKKMINGKKAIVENTRYPFPDEYHYISFILDRNEKEMYVYTNEDGLLIIQVGNSDEGPKYIAYK